MTSTQRIALGSPARTPLPLLPDWATVEAAAVAVLRAEGGQLSFTTFCVKLYERCPPAHALFKPFSPKFSALKQFPGGQIVYEPWGANGVACLVGSVDGQTAPPAAVAASNGHTAHAAAASPASDAGM